jgi:hypothetical protein
VKVVPAEGDKGALIDGRRWRRALADEQVIESAPRLPERGVRE